MRKRLSQRGQGLVEFAVIFPLFMIFVSLMVDGGLLMGRYNNMMLHVNGLVTLVKP